LNFLDNEIIDAELWDPQAFETALQAGANPVILFKKAAQQGDKILAARFERDIPVHELVLLRARLIDQLLRRAWNHYLEDPQSASLIAVGGYGRGELHPASDVDILVLLHNEHSGMLDSQIEQFLTLLWDMKLDVGHSVRSLAECIQHADNDITIATNLMESRLLAGDKNLYQVLLEATGPEKIWPGRKFYQAKIEEQIQRHHRFGDTSYNLEPNIKENPGGLRDIQVIGWVAKRHFGVTTLKDLVDRGFLTPQEFETLEKSQDFLWKIRFGLHLLATRKEDRLLFDYQRVLAHRFGYKDSEHRLAVEQMMKQYYSTVMDLNRLNEMLLQLFDENILQEGQPAHVKPINRRFQESYGFIEVNHDRVFKRNPFALLEIFLILAQRQDLKGVRAQTIRLIRDHCYLIDENFRKDLRCQSLFMEIFRQPQGLTHELRRMNRYGVLAAYLPAFGNIVGLMQHDLFHVFTVDEHTLSLVRNLRRFTVPRHYHEFPLCSEIIQNIAKPELLFLAGFFHDIAKGRGGDHSTLGAQDSIEFSKTHGLSHYDTNIIAWLVENHLIMSTTAQRKDISDNTVIQEFAHTVGTQERLDYLYLLTVADIRATSPSLWNSWKNALLMELYYTTTRAFRRGLGNPIEQSEKELEIKSLALRQLQREFDPEQIDKYWNSLEQDYFGRHSVDEIVWHTKSILHHSIERLPLVLVRPRTHRGGTELFVCAKDHPEVFAIITATLERAGLTIANARISSSRLDYKLYTFIILEKSGDVISDQHRIDDLIESLSWLLVSPKLENIIIEKTRVQLPRQLKHFTIPTEVSFRSDNLNKRTIMEVVALDQPGLLAKIALALLRCGVTVQNAKIATFGEKAEDIFFVTDSNHREITDKEQLRRIETAIVDLLNDHNPT